MSIFKVARKGFTLAELLIALAILGVIATFTIPKILSSATSGQNTAVAKEAASMISGAMSTYLLNNSLATTTTPGALTAYMNYVSTNTSQTMSTPSDSTQTALATCTATLVCLKLHNGGILQYATDSSFNSTGTTAAIIFNVDPDGPGTGAGRASFIQYTNGRLTTAGNVAVANTSLTPGTITSQTTDSSYIANWN